MKTNQQELLLFWGSGRTGSTLLGQLINYHPNCLVANEYHLLKRMLEGPEEKIADIFEGLETKARSHYESGLEADPHYRETMSKSQTHWNAMGHLGKNPAFFKKDILILGDKKAGENSALYQKHPEKIEELVARIAREKPVRLIQIIRHPLVSARSLMKSHKVPTLEKACRQIVSQQVIAAHFLEKNKNKYPTLRLFYEDLLENPKVTIRGIIEWLGLECDEGWLEVISGVVAEKKESARFTPQEYRIVGKAIRDKKGEEVFRRYQLPAYGFTDRIKQWWESH